MFSILFKCGRKTCQISSFRRSSPSFFPFLHKQEKKKLIFLDPWTRYLTLPRRHVFLRSGQPISSPQKQTRAAVKSVVISGETKYPVGREMPSLPIDVLNPIFFHFNLLRFFSLPLLLPPFSFPLLFFHSFRRRSVPLYSGTNIISISQMMYDRFMHFVTIVAREYMRFFRNFGGIFVGTFME